MKKHSSIGRVFLLGLLTILTSCEDILGHWERPTSAVTPSGSETPAEPEEETALPEGTLTGKFSVSATKQVRFSQGNLQAKIASYASNAATASEWKFADSQYSCIGNEPGNTSFDVDTWVDLFCWVGNSASNNTYGLITFDSYSPANHGNNTSESLKTDWGKLAISNGGNAANSGWRTLTKDEWTYLFNTRSGATVNSKSNVRCTMANINTDGTPVNGMILFPDGITVAASEANPWGTFNNCSNYTTECTSAQWSALADKGCVFLPAAGWREGTSVDDVGSDGYYWSLSPDDTNADDASSVYFDKGNLHPGGNDDRKLGFSVRLVRDVE